MSESKRTFNEYFAAERKLISQGFSPNREELISMYSNGQFTSLRQLDGQQYRLFIDWLHQRFESLSKSTVKHENGSKDKMRKKIIGIAHDMGWHLPGTDKADMSRINKFLLSKYGQGKHINALTEYELTKAIYSFQQLRQYHFSNKTRQNQ